MIIKNRSKESISPKSSSIFKSLSNLSFLSTRQFSTKEKLSDSSLLSKTNSYDTAQQLDNQSQKLFSKLSYNSSGQSTTNNSKKNDIVQILKLKYNEEIDDFVLDNDELFLFIYNNNEKAD